MISKQYQMTIFLFVSNFALSKHLSVFVPLWLSDYALSYIVMRNGRQVFYEIIKFAGCFNSDFEVNI